MNLYSNAQCFPGEWLPPTNHLWPVLEVGRKWWPSLQQLWQFVSEMEWQLEQTPHPPSYWCVMVICDTLSLCWGLWQGQCSGHCSPVPNPNRAGSSLFHSWDSMGYSTEPQQWPWGHATMLSMPLAPVTPLLEPISYTPGLSAGRTFAELLGAPGSGQTASSHTGRGSILTRGLWTCRGAESQVSHAAPSFLHQFSRSVLNCDTLEHCRCLSLLWKLGVWYRTKMERLQVPG